MKRWMTVLFILALLVIVGCTQEPKAINPSSLQNQLQQQEGPLLNYAYDINKNNEVDFPDFVSFASAFNTRREDVTYLRKADFTRNGEINFEDFVKFSQNFGKIMPANYERQDAFMMVRPSEILKVDLSLQQASFNFANEPLIDPRTDIFLENITAESLGYRYIILLPKPMLQEGGFAMLAPGNSFLKAEFVLPKNIPDEVFLRINHLSSAFSGQTFGFSPTTLSVNGFVVWSHKSPLDTGLKVQDTGNIRQFLNPGKENVIEIQLDRLRSTDPYKTIDEQGNEKVAGTTYWLNSVDVMYGRSEYELRDRDEVRKPTTLQLQGTKETGTNFTINI